MAQLTIYLDEVTKAKMEAAAKSAGVSCSKWVARLINEKMQSEWPDWFIELSGAWPDFPSAEEIRSREGTDLPREPL